MPTGQILEQPFHARLTKDGERHPVTRDLPGGDIKNPTWGRWYRQIDVIPERGRIDHAGRRRQTAASCSIARARAASPFSPPIMPGSGRADYDGGGPHTQLLRRFRIG